MMRAGISRLRTVAAAWVVVAALDWGQGGMRADAAPEEDFAGRPAALEAAVPEAPPIRKLENGLFACGEVQFSKSNRFVRIPALINMDRGFVEYLLVEQTGKVHESLLSTRASPYHIHLAMLLIGAKGAQEAGFPEEGAGPLPGDRIRVELTWESGGKKVRRRAEQCIQNSFTGEALADGPWVYNGSRTLDRQFLAQRDGSIVSVMTDPDALVNNPRPGRDRDDIWQIRSQELAPLGTAVEMTLWLE